MSPCLRHTLNSRVVVQVSDYDAGTPINANGITFRSHMPLRPDLPDSTLRVAPSGQAGPLNELVSNGSGGGPGQLTVRTLEPGHVVGSRSLNSGNYQVEVTAMNPDGTAIDAVVPMNVP